VAAALTHPLPQARRDLWAPVEGWQVEDVSEERRVARADFRVPDTWRERTLLRFGAVDWRARVTVDGEEVAVHEGGYTHFTADLGPLRPGSEHAVVVDAFDPLDDAFGQAKGKQRGSHGIWYTRTIGIWRPVWIEGVPDEHILDTTLEARADGTVRWRGEVVLDVGAPRLWSPAAPVLYDVDLRLGDDVVHSYVGFRTIERRGRELLLNGEPLRIAGVLDQGFWPGTIYAAPHADALRADVEAAKALGFNLARKHVKVEDPRWYAWCDRLGLLVAQDMPSSHSLAREEARTGFLREWLEIVGQLRNHPSIVLWIPVNEDWGKPPPGFQRELVRATRAADPTRLVVDASGWNQLDDTDLVDVHDYGAELTRHLGVRDDIPLWFGELGGISVGTGAFAYRHVADLADAYRRVVGQVPEGAAGFVWTQLTDVEGEQNGLLDAARRPKVDPDVIRAVNEAFLR
jgi:beta-galactosidase/beta-glucuronidase